MRTSLAFFASGLLAVTAACGSNGSGPIGDDDVGPDAGDVIPPPPERGFRIESPPVEIAPGQEITYCYYFHTPNTEMFAVNHWRSTMTPGSHHMILFQTANDLQPEGTLTDQNCDIGASGTTFPVWTYSAQEEVTEVQLPADDGTGKPLAQELKANGSAFVQMHYLNATDQPLTAHVVIDAFALVAGVAYTSTSPLVTYNGHISIPPNTNDVVVSQSCSTPTDAQFWLMSTHAHKQAVKTRILDGADMVFESTDWEHPGFQEMSPFYTFATNKLTYECTYDNPTNRTITDGESADTDEMCMATGYFFPATKPVFCYNNFVLPF